MKNKKIFLFIFVLISLVFFNFLVRIVRAVSTDTVSATVTAQNISVSVDNVSIAFGTIGVGSTANTTASGVNDSSIATNDGNITEKFNIKAANSTNWTLAATAGSENYTMKSCITNCDSSPTWTSVGIDPSYATLVASVGVGGTGIFDLQVGTPTSTASYGQQTITVTVQATTP